jgi:nicotinamidase-related amidase
MKKVLLVVDVQNDYFPGGNLPLWNIEPTLDNIERAIKVARVRNDDPELCDAYRDFQVG